MKRYSAACVLFHVVSISRYIIIIISFRRVFRGTTPQGNRRSKPMDRTQKKKKNKTSSFLALHSKHIIISQLLLPVSCHKIFLDKKHAGHLGAVDVLAGAAVRFRSSFNWIEPHLAKNMNFEYDQPSLPRLQGTNPSPSTPVLFLFFVSRS